MAASTNPQLSEQYDTITDAYAVRYSPDGSVNPSYPIAEVEEYQLRLATLSQPVNGLEGKRILDLACGNGNYSRKYLRWGAESVVGVDVSKANAYAHQNQLDHELNYVLGDATDETLSIEGGPFDVIVACWLLNYAPDVEAMIKMYRTAGRHLKVGGSFVGLTIPPLLSDLPAERETLNNVLSLDGACGKYGNAGKVIAPTESGDGYRVLVELGLRNEGHRIASFECCYLQNTAFEKACKDSGMFNGLEWREFVVPHSAKKGRPVGYWNELMLSPNCRVCVATRVRVEGEDLSPDGISL
ncbi:hypothetical protein LTR56_014183 [Elasticomyces elasticus]|nr:hypothetical protein LTR56_014183 [Elasticomyces elasticus]KAK3645240.1 hypothetical protein LTR22_014818 [Elasticomyces elasticus]KAK4917349.1 hypothetical protein LTR49_014703 [Elasticomyces elasticus]KAK5755083.1 hypothetical protein LTS12_014766 [Elasticomyces elasticus]